MSERMKCERLQDKVMTADEAALLVKDGMTVATSGFTPAGYPKAVPLAVAKRAENGEQIGLTLITGASVGDELDGAWARAGVTKRRYPYQTNSFTRNAINDGKIAYADLHLSQTAFYMKMGYFGKIDLAIVEACEIDEKGHIYPTTSGGIANVAVDCADKVIIEVNAAQSLKLKGIHDVYSPKKPPNTEPIPIVTPKDRIGVPYIECPAEKIAAIVLTDIPDGDAQSSPADADQVQMAQNLITFLKGEVAKGRMGNNLMPLQSGVGTVANAVLGELAKSDFEHLTIYTEVLQDAVLDLMDAGKVDFASTTALTLSKNGKKHFYDNIDQYIDKIVIRPSELSNNPEVIRRLSLIGMNTAIECDIYGNVNSTHIGGTRLMNGIGGSGDFARNSGLVVFFTASTAKEGTVSSIVPYVTHIDHTEHDVHVIVTEQGVADLRGLSPVERANAIINNCAHPKFRPELQAYLEKALSTSKYKHIPHCMSEVFDKGIGGP